MKPSDYNLIERYMDGTASAEELVVLDGRLRVDPALRLELIKEAGFEAQLRLLLRTAPAVATDAVSDDEQIDVVEQDLPERKVLRWRPSWLWIPVAAAAAALVVALFLPTLNARRGGAVAHAVKTGSPAIAKKDNNNPNNALTKNSSVKSQEQQVEQVANTVKNENGSENDRPKVVVADPATKPEKTLTHDDAIARADIKNDARVQVQDVRMAPPVPAPKAGANPVLVVNPPVAPAPGLEKVALSPVAAAVMTRVDGQIVSANGSVYLSRATPTGKSRHELLSGENFQAGDTLETGPLSGVFARYADGSTVRLHGNTSLTMNGAENSRNLWLGTGAIDLRVQPLGAGSNLVVTTPYVQARVLGTEFRVMSDDKGTWVGVRTGRVEVVRSGANGEVVQLNPGYFAASFRGWPPAPLSDPNWRSRCQQFTGSPKYP
jgi:hypothetical protein